MAHAQSGTKPVLLKDFMLSGSFIYFLNLSLNLSLRGLHYFLASALTLT
jgi:hypothetical protein